jgi:4-hydroxybenzoate polyprenyltransferase
MIALGRLLRLSLAPSAAADVAAGLALGAAGAWPGRLAALLIPASLCVYHGALALNDWADRAGDLRTRPDRPLPSGRVAPGTALVLAAALILTGVGLAFSASTQSGLWLGAVAVAAVAYDLRGRGALLGPLLLALCRAGNLALGLLAPAWAAGSVPDPRLLLPALLYGGYVFSVSRLGRLEDDEDPRPLGVRPRVQLVLAATCLALVPAAGLALPEAAGAEALAASCVVAWVGAEGLVRVALRTRTWTRLAVGRCMGLALRRLLAFSAACALLAVGRGVGPWIAAGIALAGYPLSFGLRRVFPPS